MNIDSANRMLLEFDLLYCNNNCQRGKIQKKFCESRYKCLRKYKRTRGRNIQGLGHFYKNNYK